MHINIVTVASGWILQKIAQRTAQNCVVPGINMSVSHSPMLNADVNYYVDLQNCYFNYKTKLDIAYFTHADLNSTQWVIDLFKERNAMHLNGIISMNYRYTKMLESIGYPKDKLITIVPGETKNMFPLRKIIIGVVSRGGYPGYGQQFMEDFFKSYNCTNFRFRFLGNGWGNLAVITKDKGIEIEFLSDVNYDIYPEFYRTIDYLLIPGLWTAGPMSMQEALSTGTPIIGADIGFVNYEFKADYVFEPGNVPQLSSILDGILSPLLNRRAQVEDMSWIGYATDVVNFILRMKGAL
jgi:glycosyltransferase involved in cell wall biosynthesis